jgi:uncharacterized protein YraI
MIVAIKLLCTLCLVLALASLFAAGHFLGWEIPSWQLPEDPATTAWVNTDAVNLRAEPSTDSAILDVLPLGTVVTVTGASRSGFTPVEYDGARAWMFAEYLSSDTTEPFDPGLGAQNVQAAEPESSVPETGPPPGTGTDKTDNTRTTTLEPQPDAPDSVEPALAEGEHWIDVDRGTATVTLYIGDSPQKSFTARIGRDPSDDGFYSTAVGTYHVFSMDAGLNATPFVENVYMTDFVGFDPERHNGFHSPIRDASGSIIPSQNPTTLGCVRLDEAAAKAVYAFAYIGMRVEVHN